jgi:hypothetical protein
LSGGDTGIRKTRDIGQGRVKDEGDGKGKGCQRSAVKAGVPRSISTMAKTGLPCGLLKARA